MENYNNRNDDFGSQEMHSAVCDECKKDCEVPFKPTEGKPVYCKDCYSKRKPRNNDRRGGGGGGFNRGFKSNFGQRQMHSVVCDECKKDCEVPFKPTEGKPVYCRDCFDKMKPKF